MGINWIGRRPHRLYTRSCCLWTLLEACRKRGLPRTLNFDLSSGETTD